MIFQAIDDKNECVGVYVNGRLYFENIPINLSKTWSYAGSLKDKDIQYASIYANGKSIEDCCPQELSEEYEIVKKKMTAYMKSFTIAKINLNEHCIFDMIPHDFLARLCDVKNQITKHVFENFEKPPNYDHLVEIQKLLHNIKHNRLNINVDGCRSLMTSTVDRNKIKQLTAKPGYIDYNMFGTVTGRLTTKPDSFPILTLKKEYRKIVKPANDLFISLDYNAAEIRTLIELSGGAQPQEDVHIWNIHNVFEEPEMSREAAKTAFFAWLYNPDSNRIDTNLYDRQKVLDKYYFDGYIHTPHNRKIQVEERKALNYLIQSTTADRVLQKAVIINKMLNDRDSRIAAIMHDEIIIDYSDKDRDLILDIKEEFEGNYIANIRGGKDLYDLNELKI